jgi:SAM-dependent MidA family methyltransferase
VSLEEEIKRRITERGPLPFAAFMSLALYDPRSGYYARGHERTGWRGHFLTSPELDPAFGELWANAFRQVWDACDRPASFEIVEIGPGEGTFASAVLNAVDDELRAALTYRLVERVAAVADRQRVVLEGFERVEWCSSVTDLPDIAAGCVFANEVLDNLPVHLVTTENGRLMEMCVGIEGDRLTLVPRPPSNPELEDLLARTGARPQNGIVEVGLAAESLVAHVTGRLRRGAILFVDYGAEASELAHRGGTLLAYSEAGVDDRVLERPGDKDITAHANWTSVRGALERAGMASTGPLGQRDVLLTLGARALDLALKDAHDVALSEGRGTDAVAHLSRRQALGALLDPAGLGGLQVVAGWREIEPPAFLL